MSTSDADKGASRSILLPTENRESDPKGEGEGLARFAAAGKGGAKFLEEEGGDDDEFRWDAATAASTSKLERKSSPPKPSSSSNSSLDAMEFAESARWDEQDRGRREEDPATNEAARADGAVDEGRKRRGR